MKYDESTKRLVKFPFICGICQEETYLLTNNPSNFTGREELFCCMKCVRNLMDKG